EAAFMIPTVFVLIGVLSSQPETQPRTQAAQVRLKPDTTRDADIVRSIEAQGGRVIRDQSGRIVEVSLARTWATDADVERLASLKSLKRLDLSLTYVSDRGAERLKALDQLEDLNLFAAEFITDAALAFLRGNRQLKTLNLRGTDVTDTSLQYVA